MPDPSGKTAFLKDQMALQVADFFTSETSEKIHKSTFGGKISV